MYDTRPRQRETAWALIQRNTDAAQVPPCQSDGGYSASLPPNGTHTEVMTMPMRRCAWPNCPQLVPLGQRYCAQHATVHERQRGSAARRGYGRAHQMERARWRLLLAQGARPVCKRCGHIVKPDQSWDLGHSDDRAHWTGPEHAHCNRSAGQANSMLMREHWR